MPDFIVSNYIDNFMRASDETEALSVLGVDNIDNWNDTYTTVQSNSSNWLSPNSIVDTITSDYILSTNDNNKQLTHSTTSAITAYITDDVNIDNFGCTISQLDYGSITVKLSSNYVLGETIMVNNVDYTTTRGSSINIKRVADNTFLISPVFFYSVL